MYGEKKKNSEFSCTELLTSMMVKVVNVDILTNNLCSVDKVCNHTGFLDAISLNLGGYKMRTL